MSTSMIKIVIASPAVEITMPVPNSPSHDRHSVITGNPVNGTALMLRRSLATHVPRRRNVHPLTCIAVKRIHRSTLDGTTLCLRERPVS